MAYNWFGAPTKAKGVALLFIFVGLLLLALQQNGVLASVPSWGYYIWYLILFVGLVMLAAARS